MDYKHYSGLDYLQKLLLDTLLFNDLMLPCPLLDANIVLFVKCSLICIVLG